MKPLDVMGTHPTWILVSRYFVTKCLEKVIDLGLGQERYKIHTNNFMHIYAYIYISKIKQN